MSAPNQAERFRRARTELEQAIALGCSILDLRRRNRALAHRAQVEVAERTADLMARPAPVQADEQDAPGYWWMKD